MIAAPFVAGLLVATVGAPHQTPTEQMMQVRTAKEIAQGIAPGATVEEVTAQTRRLGVASTTYLRCTAGAARCAESLDKAGATKRVDKWIVSNHTLVVVYCGTHKTWRAAAVDLSEADRPDPLRGDPQAVVVKKDDELAKACEAR